MRESSDDRPVMTPLVVGLTRAPTLWGVPYMAVVVIAGVTIIAWLATTSPWALLAAPLAYVTLFTLCSWDHRVLDVLQVWARMTPPTPNRCFWGAASYGP